jgi:hypothetical protein
MADRRYDRYNRSDAGQERRRRYEERHPERQAERARVLRDREDIDVGELAHDLRLTRGRVEAVLAGRGTAYDKRDVAEALGIDERDL